MKKYLFFLPLIIFLSSCTEDVKFNNPAFQSLNNNVFWRAQNYKAFLSSDGGVTIVGQLGLEKVTLQTASTNPEIYILGVNDVSMASYSNTLQEQTNDFSTGTNKGGGQIVITDYDTEANTVSGTFRFNAVNADQEDVDNPTVTFNEGVFYKVLIDDDGLE